MSLPGNDDVFHSRQDRRRSSGNTGRASIRHLDGLLRLGQSRSCDGEGQIYLGQLDANVVALDMKTRQVVWKTPIEKCQNGYGVTSAPLYYDG